MTVKFIAPTFARYHVHLACMGLSDDTGKEARCLHCIGHLNVAANTEKTLYQCQLQNFTHGEKDQPGCCTTHADQVCSHRLHRFKNNHGQRKQSKRGIGRKGEDPPAECLEYPMLGNPVSQGFCEPQKDHVHQKICGGK
jgi:hypothetical protein